MHEAGLMRAAVAALAAANEGRPVIAVQLAVGAGVDLAAADTAWRLAAAGTCTEGAQVRWQQALDRLRCFGCGTEFEGRPTDACPACAEVAIVLAPADEIMVLDWS